MLQINSDTRRQLRARAHGLAPVVSIAQHGLTEAVIKEIDTCLKAHELIKIRVYHDERDTREAYLASICEQLAAAPVQHIGKLLVVWRPKPADEQKTTNNRPRRSPPRRTKRSHQGT